jgi:hypothetical protein
MSLCMSAIRRQSSSRDHSSLTQSDAGQKQSYTALSREIEGLDGKTSAS